MNSFLYRLGRTSARHPFRVLGMWLVSRYEDICSVLRKKKSSFICRRLGSERVLPDPMQMRTSCAGASCGSM